VPEARKPPAPAPAQPAAAPDQPAPAPAQPAAGADDESDGETGSDLDDDQDGWHDEFYDDREERAAAEDDAREVYDEPGADAESAAFRQRETLAILSCTRALQEDLADEESVVDLESLPARTEPRLDNLLNPAPPSGRACDRISVTPLVLPHGVLDIPAILRLRVIEGFNSDVHSERSHELMEKYAPKRLISVVDDLHAAPAVSSIPAAPLPPSSSGVLENPMPRLIAHRVSHAAATNSELQDLMYKNQGGYSRKERFTTTPAASAESATAAKAGTGKAPAPERATTWAPGRDILDKAAPLRDLRECDVVSRAIHSLCSHCRQCLGCQHAISRPLCRCRLVPGSSSSASNAATSARYTQCTRRAMVADTRLSTA
jgi:hypothetical protein